MDISMDIHEESVDMDMDMDVIFHIHGNPENYTIGCMSRVDHDNCEL